MNKIPKEATNPAAGERARRLCCSCGKPLIAEQPTFAVIKDKRWAAFHGECAMGHPVFQPIFPTQLEMEPMPDSRLRQVALWSHILICYVLIAAIAYTAYTVTSAWSTATSSWDAAMLTSRQNRKMIEDPAVLDPVLDPETEQRLRDMQNDETTPAGTRKFIDTILED